MACVDCRRPMRPYGVLTKNAPGTVARGTHDRCNGCHVKRRDGVPAQCRRCPATSYLVKGLCADCRDVLSKEEKAIWVA